MPNIFIRLLTQFIGLALVNIEGERERASEKFSAVLEIVNRTGAGNDFNGERYETVKIFILYVNWKSIKKNGLYYTLWLWQ